MINNILVVEKHNYELTAVLMHSGVSAFSGHYTAHIHKHDHWYSFNDTNVVKLKGKKLNLTNEETLDINPGELVRGVVTPTLYKLVY